MIMSKLVFIKDRPAIINVNILQCSNCQGKFAYEDYTSTLTLNVNFCPLCGCYFEKENLE